MSNVKTLKNCTTDVLALERRGYKFGKKIGKGSYGNVVSASFHDLQSNSTIDLACKYVNKRRAPEDFLEKFFPRELDTLTQISHPNIIKVHSILQSGDTVFIFMRKAENGDLLEYVKRKGPIGETQANLWFYQMTSAIKYLHALNIAHRDLKCENILISKHMNLKLADFGFARYCLDEKNEKVMSETFCGSAALQSVTSITVSPDFGRNITTTTTSTTPKATSLTSIVMQTEKPRKSMIAMKIDNTTLLSGETLEAAADNRIRRLVPYMTFYIPTNDYNFPLNYQPQYQQQQPQQEQHQKNNQPHHYQIPLALKPQQPSQIPPVGLLYGVNQGKINRPIAQAGFILKPRPDHNAPYKPFQIPVAVQVQAVPHPSQPTRLQPERHPSAINNNNNNNLNNNLPKYPPVVSVPKKNYTPFLPENQLPGGFVPITDKYYHHQHQHHVKDPYNNYDENLISNKRIPTSTLAPIRYQQIQDNNNINSYEDDDDYNIQIRPTPQPVPDEQKYYQKVPEIIYGNKRPNEQPIVHTKYIYPQEPEPEVDEYDDDAHHQYGPAYPQQQPQQFVKPKPTVIPIPIAPLHTSTFVPTKLYLYTTPAPQIISSSPLSVTPKYPSPVAIVTTPRPIESHQEYDSESDSEELEEPEHYSSPSPPPTKYVYQQVTTVRPIAHIKPTTFSPDKYYDSYKYVKIKDSVKYSAQIKQEQPGILTGLEPVTTPQFIPTPHPPEPQPPHKEEFRFNDQPLPDLGSSSLAEILRKLQESNHLPKTLTPDNIDNSIRTLVKILNNLKNSQTPTIPETNQVISAPPNDDYDYNTNNNGDYDSYYNSDVPQTGEPGPSTGRPGIDYPIYHEIPQTNFSCKEQRYKGFFGDPESGCQSWHYCDLNGGQASFLCPNGTIFSQIALTCDWWFNVKCDSTAQLYVLNERLYKFILPFTPKFPEDYNGPLVDKYLALKFQEMEEKMRQQKEKGRESGENENNETSEDASSQETVKLENSEEVTVENNELNTLEELEGIKPHTPAPSVIDSSTQYSTSLPTIPAKLPPVPKTQVESERLEVIEIKTDGTSGHLHPLHDQYDSK